MAEEDEIKIENISRIKEETEARKALLEVKREERLEYTKEIVELQKKAELSDAEQDTLQKLLQLRKDNTEAMKKIRAELDKASEKYQEVTNKIKELQDVGKTAADNIKDLGRAFGIPKNFEKGLAGSIIKLGMMNSKTEEGQKAMEGFKKGFEGTFSKANILMAATGFILTAVQDAAMFLFKRLKDVAIAFDEMSASVNKSVLSGEKYVEIARQSALQNIDYGITAEVAGEAAIALAKNLDLATDRNKSFSDELINTVGFMSRLGADAGQTTKALSFFQRGLKQNEAQTKKTALEMFKLSKGLTMDLGESFEQLNSAMPTLAAHGDEMMEVFKAMSAQARASGASMQTLLSVAAKFDTFQQSAQAAASLNSILGGAFLNSTELLRMSEEERLETIIKTVQAQGIAFKDMDRFRQKAIATAVGITDMAEANKLFGMSAAEYEAYKQQTDAAQASQNALKKAVDEATPVIEKLQLAVAKFVAEYGEVIEDILKGTLDIARSFLEWKESGSWVEPWGLVVITVIGSITAAVGLLATMIFKVGAAALAITPALKGIAGAAGVLAAGSGVAAGAGTTAAASGAAVAGAGGLLVAGKVLAVLAGVAALGYAGYKLFEGNDRATPGATQSQRTAQSEFVIDNATLNLTFSAEETVKISKTLTNVGLKANGMA